MSVREKAKLRAQAYRMRKKLEHEKVGGASKQHEAARKRSARAAENGDDSTARRLRDAERHRAVRATDTESDAHARRATVANAVRRTRKAMSQDDANARRTTEANRNRKARAAMSEEDANAKRAANAIQQRRGREMEDEAQTATRRAKNAAAMKKARQEKAAEKQQLIDSNRAHFGLTEMTDDTNFDNFEHHPEASVILYHVNSGHENFSKMSSIIDSKGDDPDLDSENMKTLLEEINDEILTLEEQDDLVKKYLSNQGILHQEEETLLPGIPQSALCPHLICGMCGIKQVHHRYGRECGVVLLKDLPISVTLDDDALEQYEERKRTTVFELPMNEKGETKPFHMYLVESKYTSPILRKVFYLHPESIHTVTDPETTASHEATVLCWECHKWYLQDKKSKQGLEVVPRNSIAAGIDFGSYKRAGLETPTIAESILLAKFRHFHNVVKIHANHLSNNRSDGTKSQLRGSSLMIKHDGPVVAVIGLLLHQIQRNETLQQQLENVIDKCITIQLVGPGGAMENIYRCAKKATHLKCRPHVFYQHLTLSHHFHDQYKDDPKLPLGNNPNFNQLFQNLAKAFSAIENNMIDNAARITDKVALQCDVVEGDDVAAVRSRVLDEEEARNLREQSSQAGDEEQEVNMSHSFLTSCHLENVDDEESDVNSPLKFTTYVEMIAKAFNIRLPKQQNRDASEQMSQDSANSDQPEFLQSTREEAPANEFTDLQTMLTGAFPQVFVLGKTYKSSSLLNPKNLEHLLLQFTNVPATNRELIYYLFDIKTRHRVIHNFSNKIRSDPQAWSRFAEMCVSDEFTQKVISAAKECYENKTKVSKQAQNLFKIVLPVLSFGARHAVPGAIGDTTSHSRGIGMTKRYGPGSGLITGALDDVNNPSTFRLTFETKDNTSFPSVVNESFLEDLQESKTHTFKRKERDFTIPAGYSERISQANGNPVVVAIEFRTMIENVLQILIGCPLDFAPGTNSKQVRTWYFKSKANNSPRHKGIFGYVTAYFGCIETQARGALHFHLIIWGGIVPRLLEQCVAFEEVCKKVQEALDTMYNATLPVSKHVEQIMTKHIKKSGDKFVIIPSQMKCYMSQKLCPMPRNQLKWKEFHYDNVSKTGIHDHTFTCKKPPAGNHRCRGGYKAGLNSKTQPLLLGVPEEQAELPLKDITPEIIPGPITMHPSPSLRDYDTTPIPPLDDRLIVWELGRPKLEPPFEELPLQYTNAFKQATEVDFMEVAMSEDDLKLTLDEAKEYCIAKIKDSLVNDPDTAEMAATTSTAPTIEKWLYCQTPVTVIRIYNNLLDEIPERNTSVVPTNVTLHNCTGSNTNALLLGNAQQSCASLFYILPSYLTKNKVALQESLIALEHAREHIIEYPSSASDSGTSKRFVQHLFTKTVNDLSRSVQLSDSQVALYLLNMGTEVTSDSFTYFGANYAINYFQHMHQKEPNTKSDCTTDLDPISESLPADNESVGSYDSSDSFLDDDDDILDMSDTESETSIDNSHSPLLDRDSDTTNYFTLFPDDDMDHQETTSTEEIPPVTDEYAFQAHGKGSFGPAGLYRVPKGEHETHRGLEDSDSEEEDDGKDYKTVPVHYPAHWWCRGDMLKDLTWVEYAALIDVKPKSTQQDDEDDGNDAADTTKNKKPGRKTRQQFEFTPQHPLASTHVQVLRAKQPTLIFNAHPPKHPGKKPVIQDDMSPFELQEATEALEKWKIKAETFAAYFSICFLPHPHINGTGYKIPRDYLSWSNFCARIKAMESSGLLIDRLRLSAMYTFIYGHRSNKRKEVLFTNFRHRNSTRWTQSEKEEAKHYFNALRSNDPTFNDDDDFVTFSQTNFSTRVVTDKTNTAKHCDVQQQTMFGIFCGNEDSVFTDSDRCQPPPDFRHNVANMNKTRKALFETAAKIKAAQLPPDDSTRARPNLRRDRYGNFISKSQQGRNFIDQRNLSPSQSRIIETVYQYFNSIDSYRCSTKTNNFTFQELHDYGIESLRLLLNGDPGSGKSYVIDTIVELASVMGLGYVLTTSFNGIAAVNIDGSTLCSTFHLFDSSEKQSTTKFDEDTLNKIRQKINSDNMCFMILDEVSTIDSKIIALINHQLQQVFGNDLPFGGVSVLFAGDFNQLGPVQKIFLPKDMMIYAKRNRRIRKQASASANSRNSTQNSAQAPPPLKKQKFNAAAFEEAEQAFHETNIRRNKKQRAQNKIARFRPASLAYTGCALFATFERFLLLEQQRAVDDVQHCAFIKRLSKGNDILPEDIESLPHLSHEDITNNPDEWKYAPTLVSTNLERLNICRFKAALWARDHKTYVFRWKNKIRSEENPPNGPTRETTHQKNAFFWQLFVHKAPCNLNHNINGDLALVNGAPMTKHSLAITDPDQYSKIMNLTSGPNALPFGSEIEIKPPTAVYLEMSPTLDNKPMTRRRECQMKILETLSIIPGKIVIPITSSMRPLKKDCFDRFHYRVNSTLTGSSLATATVAPLFPFDLSFAMTVHKAQGRTIPRVVIDLTCPPENINKMEFAAVFVALSRSRSRAHQRLLPRQSSSFKDQYSYLYSLKPDVNVMAFYNGYIYI